MLQSGNGGDKRQKIHGLATPYPCPRSQIWWSLLPKCGSSLVTDIRTGFDWLSSLPRHYQRYTRVDHEY